MIYLDNCATTRTDRDVAAYAMELMTEHFGNPSSLHFMGSDAYSVLEDARSKVSRMISAQNACIYFTSGGTESNNLAIQGYAQANRDRGRHIITTAIEHSSVLDSCGYLESQGFRVSYVSPDPVLHRIRAEDILKAIRPDTILISMMYVNNETGEILPVKAVTDYVKQHHPQIAVHTDLVQGYGKIPFKLYECRVDLASASSHKIHGPKGMGFLYARKECRLLPFQYGGSQESRVNPGTENVPLAGAFGLAADKLLGKVKENLAEAAQLKDYLLRGLQAAFPQLHVNGAGESSPYVLNISLPGLPSDVMVDYCSFRDIYVSGGSACSRGAASHVLRACGYPEEIVSSALRIGLSSENTKADCDALIETLKACWEEYQS